ncbi:histamine H2 receptor [Ceratitis capitata]|uniref:histamine H2 receptor n=1 Tax=Ceratitis capitata TaxID=7213 RepID=UPI000A10A442|nr:histamine H2 receptor [Ceratitis capitata]
MTATTFLTLLKYYHKLDAVDDLQEKCNLHAFTYLQSQQQQQQQQHQHPVQIEATMTNMEFEMQTTTNTASVPLEAAATTTAIALITTPAEDSSATSNIIDAIGEATIFWATCNTLIMACILAGNALTILAIITCRRLRRLISNTFILTLAISDFAVGITLPYHIAFYVGSNLGQSEILCMLRFFLMIFSCCVSILTLITIAVDRYIAIVYALHYRRFMTRRVACIIIAVNLSAGITVATVPLFYNRFKTAIECEFYEVLPTWYMAGIITPAFVLVWSLMLLIYWRIMREAAKQSAQSRCKREVQSWGSSRQALRMPDWKSMQVAIFIMGCFSICWLTYFVVVCMEMLKICTISLTLYKMAFSLAMMNSAMNPLIYCWKNTTFRCAYWRLLRCKNPNYNKPYKAEVRHQHSGDSAQCLQRRYSGALTIAVIPVPLPAPVKVNELSNESELGDAVDADAARVV